MLQALQHPVSLLVLLTSFVAGVTLRGWAQAATARLLGDRRVTLEGRTKPDPRRHVDPFGAVAALLGGMGWGKSVELSARRRTRDVVVVALVGPVLNLVVGLALLVIWRVLHGGGEVFAASGAVVLQQGVGLEAGGGVLLALAGISQLYLGGLALVPLPPLDGGRVLFALAPRTPAWQRAEYQLVERNIGVAVLLALLVIPLSGQIPLLLQLVDAVLDPVVTSVMGG